MTKEQIITMAREAGMFYQPQAGWIAELHHLERFANALEQAILKKIGAPVAWEWRRDYPNGGYSREVLTNMVRALDMAEDSKNLSAPDIVTPLYKLPKELL